MKIFDILFGWSKASKCKKLIRRVQCRLKLLKNKRRCIVKQLREDVAELLKHGHEQSAFDRVEQLFKDESMVEVYDMLENFCEYIIINLHYIRKHKDCPNDINEAMSTLIFASARFGDLPELRSIRKLFGERYGQKFAMAALELLPGNLVNIQIKESLSIKTVPDEVKFKLVDEIGRTCIEPGLLLLEYRPELKEESENITVGKNISSSDIQMHNDDEEDLEMLVSNIEETEGKNIYINLSSCDSYKDSAHIVEEKLVKSLQQNDMVNFTISRVIGEKTNGAEESSSENSIRLPEEMIYLDDIEEFVSRNFQDQRLFMFKSSAIPLKPYTKENDLKETRKTRKLGGKRLRRSGDMNDVECATYYGERLSNYNTKSLNWRKHHKKNSVEAAAQENEKQTNTVKLKSSLTYVKYKENSLKEERNQYGVELPKCSFKGEQEIQVPHLRAMSMPLERPKESPTENVLRSNSFPLQQIKESSAYRHIHPKLPDYDELAAKFMALRKENLQNKQNQQI